MTNTNTIEALVLIELRRIIRATQLNARSLAQQSGMTPSQLVVMQLLQARQESTAREISQAMHLTQATVTTLLDRLEEHGWIVRQRSATDRRRVLITLTPAGNKQLARAPESLNERFLREFRKLESWEHSSILAALQRIGHLLQAASLDVAPVLDVGRVDRPADGEG